MNPKRAESIGWATVNARKSSADEIYDYGATPSPPKKLPTMNIAEVDARPVEHYSAPAPTPYSVTRAGMDSVTKKSAKVKKKSFADVQSQLNNASSVGSRPVKTAKPGKTSPHLAHTQRQLDNASSVVGKSKKKSMKSIRVMSIDEAYAVMKADGAPTAVTPGAPAAPAPKKFPRKEKPTVKMKPISDGEAMANLKAGKHLTGGYEKALATGYGKTSGGGALKAPNRGARTMKQRPSDLSLSIHDLNRAMEAMPKPSGSVKPPSYLPGVHDPKSPMRPGLKRRAGGTSKKSERPITSSKKSPRPLDGGGATELSNSIKNVVHKSGGTMSKTNFNDLFKSELGTPNDDVLCACPHCDEPITKSDLAKASGHKGKGATTHLSGKEHGPSSAHVVAQNPDGGVMRGGDGKGVHTSSRGVPGAKKYDAVIGVQNSKGSKHTKKAMASGASSSESDDGSSDDASSDDAASGNPFKKKKEVKKSLGQPTTVRNCDGGFVQYVDYGDAPGSDAAIAKSISEGMLGGTPPTQPLDLNNDLTRLLI
jgi:hypothetical protein